MGKKYLDTKKGSLESSILGVWKTAIEEGDAIRGAAQMTKEVTKEEVEIDEGYLELTFKSKQDAEKAYNKINNEIWASGNPPYDDMVQEGNEIQIDTDGNLNRRNQMLKDLKSGGIRNFKVTANESKEEVEIDEKHDTHVDPKSRDELDKEPDGQGGAETAKKMKRAQEPAPGQMAEASGDKEAYKKFFNAALKKFKVSSPAELKGDDKKKFFDYIDKNWEGDNEKAEAAMSQVREFKVQSMKAALAQVWGIAEGELPPALKKAIDAKKKDKDDDEEVKKESWENAQRFKVESMKAALAQIWGVKEGHNPFKKEDDDKILKKGGKTLTGKKAAEIDLNPEIKDR